MEINDLVSILEKKKQKVSRASKVSSLIQKQRSLLKSKQTLTDFKEPVLFLTRETGIVELFENATAGRFVFMHSSGKARFIELRPSDQKKFPYAGRNVRAYFANENRPYANWDNPIVDSESLMLGYEKIHATNLKYEERMANLELKKKQSWVWWIIGLAVAIIIVMFGYSTWIAPVMERRAIATAQTAARTVADSLANDSSPDVPILGIIGVFFKGLWFKSKIK